MVKGQLAVRRMLLASLAIRNVHTQTDTNRSLQLQAISQLLRIDQALEEL